MTTEFDPSHHAVGGQPQQRPSPFPRPEDGQPRDDLGQHDQPHDLTTGTTAAHGARSKLVAAAAAVVVIGGGVATYAAVSSSDAAGGAANPRAAVSGFVTDLNNTDLVGMLNDLPPGERSAVSKPLLDTVSSLKRNDVIRPNANLSKVSGVDVAVKNLTFTGSTVVINNHVQVVQLTGGTVRVGADARKLPLTADFLKAIGADAVSGPTAQTSTVDIGREVRRNGRPIRIATQKVDGRWYPSLMYTIADNAVTSEHLTVPTAGERVPAIGAASPDQAVRSLVDALLSANVRGALELLSPEEMAVVHDYGKLIIDRSHYPSPGVRIDKLTFKDTAISGGTRVSVRSIQATVQGETISATVDGSCYTVTVNGRSQHLCAAQLPFLGAGMGSDMGSGMGSGMDESSLTARQRSALSHLLSSTTSSGLDVTRSGGRYYVNPVRSFLELGNDLLSGLKDGDGKVLLELMRS